MMQNNIVNVTCLHLYQGERGATSIIRTFQFGVVPLDWPAPREGLWRPQEALPGPGRPCPAQPREARGGA
jgi:hypothetical protein